MNGGGRVLLAALLCGCASEDTTPPALDAGADAAAQTDAAPPPRFDAGDGPRFEPPPFEAGAPVPDNPAHNPLSPPDAAAGRDAAVMSPSTDCLTVEPGETLRFEDQLSAERTWLRIEATDTCPATAVTAKRVAYQPYVLCPSTSPRVLEVIMRGSDMLDMPPRESVADAFLAVYAREGLATEDPFRCLGSSDNGIFEGLAANSARIEALELPEDATAVIFASSAERPDQRGIGLFELEINAR